jgi:hypothetical protein
MNWLAKDCSSPRATFPKAELKTRSPFRETLPDNFFAERATFGLDSPSFRSKGKPLRSPHVSHTRSPSSSGPLRSPMHSTPSRIPRALQFSEDSPTKFPEPVFHSESESELEEVVTSRTTRGRARGRGRGGQRQNNRPQPLPTEPTRRSARLQQKQYR